jgi:hypothetical protein
MAQRPGHGSAVVHHGSDVYSLWLCIGLLVGIHSKEKETDLIQRLAIDKHPRDIFVWWLQPVCFSCKFQLQLPINSHRSLSPFFYSQLWKCSCHCKVPLNQLKTNCMFKALSTKVQDSWIVNPSRLNRMAWTTQIITHNHIFWSLHLGRGYCRFYFTSSLIMRAIFLQHEE